MILNDNYGKLKKTILILMLLACSIGTILGQEAKYKFDMGGQIGMSGYLGDANTSSIFKHPGFSAGLSFRYIPNVRMAFRGVFNTLSLSGNTADMENVLPDGQQYDFKSQVYDLGFRYEFNFLPYGMGETYKRLRRWTPYLSLGVGVALATCDGSTAFAPNIPMSVGFKYKPRERWNLGVEFTMTKTFSDKIDGDKLNDLYMIKSSFLKNTDWYSNISVSVAYEFGERCSTCHYVD